MRLAQAVGLNAFGQIGQRSVGLHKGVIGMLCQRAGQVGRFIFGTLQVALVRIPNLPAVKQNQRDGNDDDKYAGLKK
ncbi:hypothetical protein D3C76_1429770 [compost metagenome]